MLYIINDYLNGKKSVTHELNDANKVVYLGITNNPEPREQQHRNDGKKFGHLNFTSRCMPKSSHEEGSR